MSMTVCSIVFAALVTWPLGTAWAQLVSSPSQDPQAGSRVFSAKGCVKCHAVNGVGGKVGPDLAKVTRPRSFYDLAADMWNHLHRMVPKMRELGISRPTLDGQEAGDLIGFLYTLNYFDQPGNPTVGKRLFTDKQCVVCHQVGGAGGAVGPSLDHLTQFRSPMYVASAMWNHGPQMAEKMKEKGVTRPTLTGAELRDLIAFLAPASGGPKEGPVYVLPGRAESGRLLFSEKHCIECHSVGGVGGKVGPDLVESGLRRSSIEFAATIWNKAPAMMAAMQQRAVEVPQLKPEDMADLVAYLYSVRYLTSGSITNGWKVALDKGCLHCHSVYGERGKPASDLTKAKGLESPATVVAALWNHAVVTPSMPGGKKAEWPIFKPNEMADLVALLQALPKR